MSDSPTSPAEEAAGSPVAASPEPAPAPAPAPKPAAPKPAHATIAPRGDGNGGLAGAYKAVTAALDRIPHCPPPREDAPDFMHGSAFHALSWQAPLTTGALLAATLTVLLGYGVMEQSLPAVLLWAGVAVVTAGGLVALANAAVPPGDRVGFLRLRHDNVVQVAADRLADAANAALGTVEAAVTWTDAGFSLCVLAGFWLAARYVEWVNSTTITLAAVGAFVLPAVLILAWPQLTQVWAKTLAGPLAGAGAALEGAAGTLRGALANPAQKQIVYGVAAAAVLALSYFMVTSYDLEYLFDTLSFLALALGLWLRKPKAA